ncbi:SusC/RagA family TonB-linked outer membrane protein [Pedobacter sp. MC2016-14]|uniref:SusC/RagA family TonB-linked outer membrane protein n=1 Tax=Pedobacter sp. MC2016-14 TaxID=2897327 RepID=UPI001E57C85E|nr:SusC/RagA family TonB-linked outer membrane protein [Pedobacter sp. MC2016-14]MCD0489153.1 SusC/RagA family TonB-linked outer membrane protein [Pedobacter sp. MC2016-14]
MNISVKKMLLCMVFTASLLFLRLPTHAQTISLSKNEFTLNELFSELRKQSGFDFVFTTPQFNTAKTVVVKSTNASLKDILDQAFAGQQISYTIRNKTIVITDNKLVKQELISGSVGDRKDRKPIPGVTVSIKGTKSMIQTDRNGKFTISVPSGATSLEFRFIGYKTINMAISPNSDYTIYMQEDLQSLNETVIRGMVERKASTFTGAAKTITGAELLQANPTNLFTAIQSLDPSFRIITNNAVGGDINALPDITVRGQGSFPTLGDQLAGNPNLPLFVLDNFEVSLQQVSDLDMNRIASITLLKDASATSIYGARGANGVMVITTTTPAPGTLEVSLTNNFTFSSPDLSVYHMLNSQEKLEFETRAGLVTTFAQQYKYAERYKEMLRGVNTDWTRIPVQTGYSNRSSLTLSGGDQTIRYGLTFNGQLLQGVMKEQDRKNYSGNFNFSYSVKKIKFRNDITLTQTVSNASPYGSFSDYLAYNPYTRPYDENGNPGRYIEQITVPNTLNQSDHSAVLNPLADVTYNSINDRNKTLNIRNQTSLEYFITDHLRLAGNLGITKETGTVDNFYSAFDSRFANTVDVSRKGTYSIVTNNSLGLDGQGRINYNNSFGRHIFTAGGTFDIRTSNADNYTLITEGFPFDRLDNLLFATQYQANGKPSGLQSTVNELSYGGVFNYTYDNRYFTDFSYTREGSSAYGENNRFASFWSAGLGWNLHNEQFLKSISQISSLRLRGSYGSTGSSATLPYASQFRYNFSTSTSYYADLGATLAGFGNLDLGPQNRLKANIGFDASLFQNRLSIVFDVYRETTQNSLTSVSLAPSTGFSSYIENLGKIENSGINFDVAYQVINNPARALRWTVSVNGALNKNILKKLSDKMKAFNDLLNAANTTQYTPNPQFIEGQSMTAIYTVRSLGIDPITGQEIYVKLDGTPTYNWDTNDKVYAGDSRAKITGALNSNFQYKGLSFGFNVRYDFGGSMYNSTLATRVEGANPLGNVDRRAFDLGWVSVGDVSKFKRISASSIVRSTSRFVQKNNTVTLQGFNLGYTFQNSFVQGLGLKNLRITANTDNAFTISSIEVERGTDNPFARSYTLSLSTRF